MRVGGKKSNQVSLRGRTGEWMESEGCSTSQWMSPGLEKGTSEHGEEICGLYADFSMNVPVFVAPCNVIKTGQSTTMAQLGGGLCPPSCQ